MKNKTKHLLRNIVITFITLIVALLVALKLSNGNQDIDVSLTVNVLSEELKQDFIKVDSYFKSIDFNKYRDDNYISYKKVKSLDVDLYSAGYLLIDLEKRDALYASNSDKKCYPASLTKLITLDTFLSLYEDKLLTDTSLYTERQFNELIEENASIAGLAYDEEYSLKDLIYALVLPSGADGAKALENYAKKDGKDLVVEMNNLVNNLGLTNTSIKNTTGLDDSQHYITLDDFAVIVNDLLKRKEGKELLSTFKYQLESGQIVSSTLTYLKDNEDVKVLGGKTGFTGEAGECLCVYYEYDDRPYLLLLYGAMGNPYLGEPYHFMDAEKIFMLLYR